MSTDSRTAKTTPSADPWSAVPRLSYLDVMRLTPAEHRAAQDELACAQLTPETRAYLLAVLNYARLEGMVD